MPSDQPLIVQGVDTLLLEVFERADWGLIIYDEVHLLPAPVFQITAALQARRRLGLTATLVREDGLEEDVFALIGPKKAEVPWRELERQGWVATAHCTEVRLPLPSALRLDYAAASPRQQFPIAAQSPDKRALVRALLRLHRDDRILVMAMYVDQIKGLAADLDIPVLTGPPPRNAATRCSGRSGTARSAALQSARSAAWRSTCRTPTSPSRSPAPSDRARRRRSAWGASCVPSATARRRTSTRWSALPQSSRSSR